MSWPTFELVRLDSTERVAPAVADRLADPGVPRGLGGYDLLDQARPLPGDDTADLICFGTVGPFGRICVRASTGAVVHVPNPERITTNTVNTDLDRLAGCVRAVADRFPFYSADSDPEDWDRAAADLRAALAAIDPAAEANHGFWQTFVDDVAMGIYSTEEVLDED
ncbi:SUKH-4 family immunity protein [Mangrovihabitans endophyticus]|uniref:SUKH-4 immunity protein n=1 Tax=Mangrovihabitans endophyticus TaxID=1751298 RepID=A0A8J3FNG7_9ACTN|nr:SUKH-4 family immunity protein [Mangrovihabitans endophyticus]GGK81457.1 hypothetical protein GCM10012284_14350 [Mangrovihabitans endophyticus]